MSDLFGNHIVGFPTRWLNYDCLYNVIQSQPIIYITANFAPTIQNADVTLAVQAGQTYTNLHTLTVTDANNDDITLSVIDGTVDGVAVNSATGVVSFTNVPNTFPLPTDPYSFEIKMSASDRHVSTLWEPKLKYCICQVSATDLSASLHQRMNKFG